MLLNVRANRERAIFLLSGPKIGSFSLIGSITCLTAVEFLLRDHQFMNTTPKIKTNGADHAAIGESVTSICVGAGRVPPS